MTPQFVACEKALAQALVLDRVMNCIGEGHDAFIATVSKEWKDHYRCAHPAIRTSELSVVESVERVHWAKSVGCNLSAETFRTAAKHGDGEVCKALYEQDCPWNESVCYGAVENERHGLRILQWLRSEHLPEKERCPWHEDICGWAGSRGNLEILNWLLSEEGNAPFGSYCWYCACDGGLIPVVECLLKHPRTRALLEENRDDERWRSGAAGAAMEGHLGVLQLLHANAHDVCDWDAVVCKYAVMRAKSLAMLKWLRSEAVQCEWDEWSCPQVIRDNRLHEDFFGVSWDITEETFEEIKQWVHANGHPCNCQD